MMDPQLHVQLKLNHAWDLCEGQICREVHSYMPLLLVVSIYGNCVLYLGDSSLWVVRTVWKAS